MNGPQKKSTSQRTNTAKRQLELLEEKRVARTLIRNIRTGGVDVLIDELRSGIEVDARGCPIDMISQKRYQTLMIILEVYPEKNISA